ncbi:hypothetical protein GvMRE_Ic5g49 [endosymbiont GvMRE of Glomus versiforme]|nr:hypothetical protein GvMRE_Ic5g49 [endosymbiont GvMRE of Glomus versiforme]
MARPAQKQNKIENSSVDGFKDQQTIQGILTSRIESRVFRKRIN